MIVSKLLIAILFTFLFVLPLHAGGTFYVGRGEGGIYFQTDNDGGWYIDIPDLKSFKIGETVTYRIGADRYGIYIVTDKRLMKPPIFFLNFRSIIPIYVIGLFA